MEIPGRPVVLPHSQLCPCALQTQCLCLSLPNSHQAPPLPLAAPSLLHVWQHLAQQQGWGLHIDIQDLESERMEGRERHSQPRPVF